MVSAKSVLDFLSKKFPLDTACDFDNVGLLIGSGNTESEKVIVCLDCDKSAVQKAIEKDAKIIVTHHPVIFDGIKSVTEESVAYKALAAGISVISMHTNLDVGKGGVNDTLCRVLELKNVKPFKAHDGFVLRSAKTDFTADGLARHIKEKLGFGVRYTGFGDVKNVLVCSGSGGDYLSDAIAGGFDALITADCKHHTFIDAENAEISLYDCGHYASENVIVSELVKLLKRKFADTEIIEYSPAKIKSV